MVSSKSPKKKRQHHVWQYYLSAWENNGKVQCWQAGKKIFGTGTKNLGVEAYFYTLRELSAADEVLINQLIDRCDVHLRPIAKGWHNVFLTPGKLAKSMGSWPEVLNSGRSPAELPAEVSELEEELHCLFESTGKPLLDSLRTGAALSPNDMPRLLPFLTTQYTRTKAVQERVVDATSGITASIWQVMRHVYASNMAMQIILSGEFKVDVLIAPGELRFITGDQPIVNAQGIWNPEGRHATNLELYYPISPTHALLVSKDSSWTKRQVSDVEANIRNATMARAAHSQVYGQQVSDLDHVANDRRS
ncbi:MAG: DUF4238 domain-containing protein [Polyangiaceae bacterium]|nr:DUF4238 domain-containing protein [Polyangiaceae bacterium]